MLARYIQFLAVAVCVAGCGDRPRPLPTTYPVHGKVTYPDGKPVAGGLIQFQPQAEPSVSTTGTIHNDGTYSLISVRDGLRAEGAVACPNRVIVVQWADQESQRQEPGKPTRQQGCLPTNVAALFHVQPRDNEYNLVINRPPR